MSRKEGHSRVWPYYVAVALAPALVLWRQDNSLFTAPGLVDSWMYLGLFENLRNFKRDLFPNTYYGSRLPWLVTGQFFYSIFSPAMAAALLHLSVLWTAAAALFTTVTATVGRRAGLLCTLIFATNPQVWNAIGSDYVDGAGIACFLLALALLTLEARRTTRGWRLLLAGATAATLVYVNLFWISLVPVLAVHYIVFGRISRGEGIASLASRAAAWCGTGFVLVTVLCGVVNARLDGLFWFFLPSIHTANSAMKDNPWYRSPWTSAGLVPWLWVTAMAGASAIVSLPIFRRRREQKTEWLQGMVAAEFGYALCLFIYLQFVRRVAVLAWPYYASILLPFTFLAIGTAFFRGAETISKRRFALVAAATAASAAIIWADYDQSVLPVWPQAIFPALIISSGLLASSVFLRNRTAALLCAAGGFAVLNAECRFRPSFQIPENTPAAYAGMETAHSNRGELERILWARERVEKVRQGRPVRFWYDEREPAVEDYRALNSTYLNLYSMLSPKFPELSCDVPIENESIVVVLSRRPDAAVKASAALPACIANRELRASPASTFGVKSPFGEYDIVILEITPDSEHWHRVVPAFDSAGTDSLRLNGFANGPREWPLEQWKALDPAHGDSLDRRANGFHLRTTFKPHTDAASYGPFSVPASGRYEFKLRYADVDGKIVFGAVSEDGSTWLCADDHGQYAHAAYERTCSTDLRSGQRIMLRLSNGRPDKGGSSMTVTGLSAVERDGAAVSK